MDASGLPCRVSPAGFAQSIGQRGAAFIKTSYPGKQLAISNRLNSSHLQIKKIPIFFGPKAALEGAG